MHIKRIWKFSCICRKVKEVDWFQLKNSYNPFKKGLSRTAAPRSSHQPAFVHGAWCTRLSRGSWPYGVNGVTRYLWPAGTTYVETRRCCRGGRDSRPHSVGRVGMAKHLCPRAASAGHIPITGARVSPGVKSEQTWSNPATYPIWIHPFRVPQVKTRAPHAVPCSSTTSYLP